MAPRSSHLPRPGPQKGRATVDKHTISPAGGPFQAAPRHDQDHPHVCNGGWITIGQLVACEETGEEVEEYALYLCRRCSAGVER